MEQEIMTILIKALISVFGIVGTYVLALIAQVMKKKQQELIAKIGKEEYHQNYEFATGIFHLVESRFKNVGKSAEEKAKMFNDLLLEKCPYLTQEDIDTLRERVVGEFNKEVKPIFEPITINTKVLNDDSSVERLTNALKDLPRVTKL